MIMTQTCMLIGSDVELMPVDVAVGQHDAGWWRRWLRALSGLPPKGERMDIGEDLWAHRDGLSAEYGIRPAHTLDEFMSELERGKREVGYLLRRQMVGVDWFSVAALTSTMDADDFLELGCSSDFQVLDDMSWRERRVPEGARSADTRECGGHIHISLPPVFLESKALQAQFVRELDDVVYPLVTMNLGDYRSWYRHRRVFRFTPYGVEYRSLGASALFAHNAESYMSLVFDMVQSAWEV